MTDLSIVIPLLNDEWALSCLLKSLADAFRAVAPDAVEIIVADGGSTDDGLEVAARHGCIVVRGQPSRGAQLQQGFLQAQGQWIWLLHADSIPDANLVSWLVRPRAPCWGRFDVRFTGCTPPLRAVAMMMNWRSRRSGICTGDQGIFAHRSLLSAIGGVPPQSLMEDIELSKRLKRQMAPLCPHIRLAASPRRWEQRGIVRTIVTMWGYRLR